jgi:hypothetical protein
MTFSDLYGYAQRMSANFKHRLLYQQMYGLARTWLDDFGKTDFRLDPRIHIDSWHADVTGLLCGGTSTCAAGPGMCVNGVNRTGPGIGAGPPGRRLGDSAREIMYSTCRSALCLKHQVMAGRFKR